MVKYILAQATHFLDSEFLTSGSSTEPSLTIWVYPTPSVTSVILLQLSYQRRKAVRQKPEPVVASEGDRTSSSSSILLSSLLLSCSPDSRSREARIVQIVRILRVARYLNIRQMVRKTTGRVDSLIHSLRGHS